MKLSIRISFLIGIVVLAASAGIGLVSLFISSQVLERTDEAAIRNEGVMNAEVISVFLKGELAVLQELANRARTRTMDWETVQPSLADDIQRTAIHNSIIWRTARGNEEEIMPVFLRVAVYFIA